MTTDDFTTTARAEAEEYAWDRNAGTTHEDSLDRDAFVAGYEYGAVWARDHLAAREPTDAEVEAAVDAWRRHLRLAHPVEGLEPSCDECGYAFGYPGIAPADEQARLLGHAMRAALAAARAVRQEKR